MAAKVHKFKVEMACEGCSGAVERVLGKYKGQGVEDVSIDLGGQLVTVKSTLTSEELLTIIKKTGKTTEYIGEDN